MIQHAELRYGVSEHSKSDDQNQIPYSKRSMAMHERAAAVLERERTTVGSTSRPNADPKPSTKPYLLEPLAEVQALESVSSPNDTCAAPAQDS